MEKKLSVVNVFASPHKEWSKRMTTEKERSELFKKGLSVLEALEVNDELIATVANHSEAATHMLRRVADNGLENHIDRALTTSPEFRALRDLMPQDEPEALRSYQSQFPNHDDATADEAIKAYGVEMAEGQTLFHGGLWASASPTITTSRPFSTSFCPQVALRNADFRGKAYDAGRLDLMVVRVTQPKTKAYAFGRESDHGHEKEVVFASGAHLTRVTETYIADVTVAKAISGTHVETKEVPGYLIEVEIS